MKEKFASLVLVVVALLIVMSPGMLPNFVEEMRATCRKLSPPKLNAQNSKYALIQ